MQQGWRGQTLCFIYVEFTFTLKSLRNNFYFRRTGQGSILKDEEYYKTTKSTFKPKALRNPNTYKNLQKNLPKESDKKKETDFNFSSKLKPAVFNDKYQDTMSKEFKEMSAKESARQLPTVALKPVKK